MQSAVREWIPAPRFVSHARWRVTSWPAPGSAAGPCVRRDRLASVRAAAAPAGWPARSAVTAMTAEAWRRSLGTAWS